MRSHQAMLAITAGTLVLCLSLPRAVHAESARQEPESLAIINEPQNNDRLTGAVLLNGTAVDPDFRYYQLEYRPDASPADAEWSPIQPPVSQQVRDGVLGLWDTTGLPGGSYTLRLRVVRGDGSEITDQVRVLITNATATPIPTPQPTPTVTPLPGTPTPGPSPTPLIQQPPTRTPRPTATPGGPTPEPPRAADPGSPLQPDRLRGAAWSGVQITLGAFALLGLYSLIRAGVRGRLRAGWWKLRREVIDGIKRRR